MPTTPVEGGWKILEEVYLGSANTILATNLPLQFSLTEFSPKPAFLEISNPICSTKSSSTLYSQSTLTGLGQF